MNHPVNHAEDRKRSLIERLRVSLESFSESSDEFDAAALNLVTDVGEAIGFLNACHVVPSLSEQDVPLADLPTALDRIKGAGCSSTILEKK